jgi:type 1 glutamine amidotransferase
VTQLLLVSAGVVHPPYRGRLGLKQTLAAVAGVSLEEVTSLPEALQRPLSGYRALVLYYHYPGEALSAAQLAAFTAFVRDGGGVLAVHSATASYKPAQGYFDVLGGRFVGHGPVQRMEIQPSRPDDDVFGGIEAFAIHDELYLHELASDIQPRFHTVSEGQPVPIVWTREVGHGRVCYVGPGHRSASMSHPAVQEILRRGLGWICRR